MFVCHPQCPPFQWCLQKNVQRLWDIPGDGHPTPAHNDGVSGICKIPDHLGNGGPYLHIRLVIVLGLCQQKIFQYSPFLIVEDMLDLTGVYLEFPGRFHHYFFVDPPPWMIFGMLLLQGIKLCGKIRCDFLGRTSHFSRQGHHGPWKDVLGRILLIPVVQVF